MVALVAIRKPAQGIPRPSRPNLRGFSRPELERFVRQTLKAPRFRADQLFEWLHHKRAGSLDDMTNLPRALKETVTAHASLHRLTRHGDYLAADGTRKLRLQTLDGHFIESVLIPNEQRGFTLCVSSQVGCAMTCRFCATASLGFTRNLDTWEIVDQVSHAQDLVARAAADGRDENGIDPQPARRLTNLVYMGMGEPLHNFNQVKRSIEILTDPRGAGIGARRITVSTSGVVPAIERFARDELSTRVGLAVSLNATTDETRTQVMPINTRWSIEALITAVRNIPASRRRDLTFEYVLLAGVNDDDDDAHRLAELVGDLRCHVNVIPFNPHDHAPYRRPSDAVVRRFVETARRRGLRVYLRTPRGDDIGAACGQLALEGERAASRGGTP